MQLAGDKAEEGALARTVRAEHGPALAGLPAPVDAVQDAFPGEGHAHVVELDEGKTLHPRNRS